MWTNLALFLVGLVAVGVGVAGLVELTTGGGGSTAVLGVVVGVFGLLALAASIAGVLGGNRGE